MLPGEFVFRDRAVCVGETLVLADCHVGMGTASNVEASLGEHEDLTRRFVALLDGFAPGTVVVAGDLLHSFAELPRGVRETVEALREAARGAGARMVVTPGNHDTLLDAAWDGPTVDEYRLPPPNDDTVVLHGHEPPESDAARYVVGHDHPAIRIEGRKRPCYLLGTGTYRGADVLMLPAFSRLPGGATINGMGPDGFLSPLVTNPDAFRPIVRDEDADETLTFPPLGQFRRML